MSTVEKVTLRPLVDPAKVIKCDPRKISDDVYYRPLFGKVKVVRYANILYPNSKL